MWMLPLFLSVNGELYGAPQSAVGFNEAALSEVDVIFPHELPGQVIYHGGDEAVWIRALVVPIFLIVGYIENREEDIAGIENIIGGAFMLFLKCLNLVLEVWNIRQIDCTDRGAGE